jgi:three-Cys-motif partner protein
VEIFFNFMVVGANRNVLWSNHQRVSEQRRLLMDKVWGDRTWVNAVYDKGVDLFGEETYSKRTNEQLMTAYCERLRRVAGFAYVPPPIPMKNTRAATIYYLVFASPNRTGAKIVSDIFNKYRQ